MTLTREAILKKVDSLGKEKVNVWGEDVWVRELTAAERDDFEDHVVQLKGKNTVVNRKNIRAELVSRTVVYENGERMFKPGDVTILGKLSARQMDKLFAVGQRLSGLSQKDVEELAGNS